MDDGFENADVGPGVQQQADVQGLMAAFQLQAVQLANLQAAFHARTESHMDDL